MAANLWGNIYFQEHFAGVLEQQPGGRYAFTYDAGYVAARHPAIAHTLPIHTAPHISETRLHPFFDNLIAEGWLRNAQARALGVPPEHRFALLLAFGTDCAGAVTVVDPDPVREPDLEIAGHDTIAALSSRASLSGIQPKIPALKEAGGYRPAGAGEISTHIAKLPSGHLADIIEIEWLTTQAVRAMLPNDEIVEVEIAPLRETAPKALLVKRFDRLSRGRKRHFEEFNQLLNHSSEQKYDAAYHDLARFIRETPACMPVEADKLYRRILACILIGNTDAHLKNFAMFHTLDGLRLTPCYDLVASALYPEYQTLALAIGATNNLEIHAVRPKHVVVLGDGYGIARDAIESAVDDLGKRLETAKDTIAEAGTGTKNLRDQLISSMERRWNGAFDSIGTLLSKRRGTGVNRRAYRNDG